MQDVPHFQEAGRMNPASSGSYMPETIYSTALDYLVFACVDLVFTHAGKVLLAKRNKQPRACWWIVGGRMVAGEQPKQTACRKAAKEANLTNLDPDRFCYVGVYSTCFAQRRQEPVHHGSHSLNLTYQIELTQVEQEQLTLRPDEYDDWQWLTLDQITKLLDTNDRLDAALMQVIQDSFRLIASGQSRL